METSDKDKGNPRPALPMGGRGTPGAPIAIVKLGEPSTEAGEAQAGQHAAHVGEAADDAGNGIVGENFVFEIDEALVADFAQRLENFGYRHFAVAHGDLAVFVLKIG